MKRILIYCVGAGIICSTVFGQGVRQGKIAQAMAAAGKVGSGVAHKPAAAVSGQRANSVGSARLYSILVPGGGQFYNGETGKGLVMLGGAVLGWTLFATNIPSTDFYYDPDYYYASYGYWYNKGNATLCYGGLALALGATAWSIIDAPKATERHNKRLGLVSVPVGNKSIWANVNQSITPRGLAYGLRIGLSF